MTNAASTVGATADVRARATAAASNLSSFIWSVADLLRGEYKPADYGKVILPFTVLRRLDCVLEPSKAAVLTELEKRTKAGINPAPFLTKAAGHSFYNTSPLDLKKLLGDQDHIAENLRAYIAAFAPSVRDIFERFDFHTQIDKLDKTNLLYLVAEKFATIDLHPDVVSNAQMGTVFEELIRRFAELSNETADAHHRAVSGARSMACETSRATALMTARRPPSADQACVFFVFSRHYSRVRHTSKRYGAPTGWVFTSPAVDQRSFPLTRHAIVPHVLPYWASGLRSPL